ncbi:unnamed protein product [Enterobius vermicularis]|uniref:G_PROTEIN_RECEP_F1_2 domain-containing protein n=1 Tax=Enterobius vermicularis TaxID=51028 RepID=A0A0N4VDG2_ENTVE|nr:unnamed protein product [Enterobius vermicularis]
MLPYCLASYPIFYNSNTFRSLLGTIKIQIGALANWFSCAAIWFVLAISIERVLIIKFPFRSLRPYRVNLTFIFHHSVSRKCMLMQMCPNGSEYTEIYVLCLSRSFENWSVYDPNWKKPSKLFELYVDVGTTCNAVLGVICPVFLVAALNILLIKLLHKSKMKASIGASSKQNADIQEKKMTKTVVTIVTCFTITNVPSAFVFLYETFFYDDSTQRTATMTFSIVSSVTNFLVITGKSLNIVLLCLSSAAFR